jgi:hypothetical protein
MENESQLSTVNYQLSTINCQLSIINYQLHKMQCEKQVYETHGDANKACRGMGRDGSSMYSYKCHRCGCWHLATHKKKKMKPHRGAPKYR